MGPALPRWSAAALHAFLAAICTWAGLNVPWRAWTVFAVATLLLAGAHVVTAFALALALRHRRLVWRGQAFVALAYLVYVSHGVLTWSVYVAELYGGLGHGIAWVLGMLWLIVVAATVPSSAWALAATRGAKAGRASRVIAGASAATLAVGAWQGQQAAAAQTLAAREDVDAVLSAALAGQRVPALPQDTGIASSSPGARAVGDGADTPSLMTLEPAACAEPPSADAATIVATHFVDGAPTVTCLQAPTLSQAASHLAALRPPLKLDVVTARSELAARGPATDLFALRPALDGVCAGARCLMPWQLLAAQSFAAAAPIDELHEIRFGVDPGALWAALASPPSPGAEPALDGLTRIETASYVFDARAGLVPLRRLRPPRRALTPETLRDATAAAEVYLARAQRDDGSFEYRLDPFTGGVDDRGLSIARQAGTTLVLCELAQDRARARELATRSLQMMTRFAAWHDDLLMFRDPDDEGLRNYALGDTALSAIALLSCRDLVGDRFDAEIDGATRLLLAMQRSDGSFHPEFDLQAGAPVVGADPLFAVGQSVFALTLLEGQAPGRFADPARVRAAVEAAMDYTAQEYWNGFGADFFYMEENWHCLAARAALPHHRHDGYERFCVDYVHFKTRLILEARDGVDADFIGGYGFGNFLIPHSSGSATFGEAAAAAIAIMDARGLPRGVVQQRLELALGFLVHHQWPEVACFACSAAHPVAGGFSEHMASPTIRIDYVQHAMGAMGHGAEVLGWTR